VLYSSVYNLFALLGRKATFTHSLTYTEKAHIVIRKIEADIDLGCKLFYGGLAYV